jgi:hypothetical protein
LQDEFVGGGKKLEDVEEIKWPDWLVWLEYIHEAEGPCGRDRSVTAAHHLLRNRQEQSLGLCSFLDFGDFGEPRACLKQFITWSVPFWATQTLVEGGDMPQASLPG